ncbi:hypothetical protein NM208_g15027 [Fusarium decemcellulare]|uniref:Uncharacterized protein n=1 Tax=Fusarium decemcellulare TaxID=57161 RepID=A0ACC1RHP5_9HYPO|nr:hypothetical protein NM208_g15027 [Fusarium decemcellulare]
MLRLPPELMDMIFQSLSGDVQVCFALTCRTLYNDYFPKTSKFFRHARNRYLITDLLYLLEKDSPDSYYCSYCQKLHRWDVPARKYRTRWEEWKGDLRSHCYYENDTDSALEFEVGEYHRLTFHSVRVAMNRHFYGPLHGMPLQDLELDTHHELCRETGASLDMSVRPQIIDDELFLSISYKLLHPQEDARNLRRLINQTQWSVCRHLQMGEFWNEDNCFLREIRFLPRRIPELESQHCPPPRECTSQSGCVMSCPICMTDYRVKISQGEEERGWAIEVVTWHQLGDGRNFLGKSWFNMAYEGYAGTTERNRQPAPNSLPGIVRHRWSKGDGSLLEIEGEFVEGLDGLPKGLGTDREGNVVLECYADDW